MTTRHCCVSFWGSRCRQAPRAWVSISGPKCIWRASCREELQAAAMPNPARALVSAACSHRRVVKSMEVGYVQCAVRCLTLECQLLCSAHGSF